MSTGSKRFHTEDTSEGETNRERKRYRGETTEEEFSEDDVLVEVVEKIEESVVLVRLPHLDFFTQTHLCEVPSRGGTGSGGSSSAQTMGAKESATPTHAGDDKGGECRYVFDPTALQVENDASGCSTLATAHPRFVLNRGTQNEMHLVGTWQETSATSLGLTNRAIVGLEKKTPEEPEASAAGGSETLYPLRLSTTEPSSSASPPRQGEGALTVPTPAPAPATTTGAATAPVASLFAHANAGLTSDEVRQTRLKASTAVQTTAIYVPSAVLVLHPILSKG